MSYIKKRKYPAARGSSVPCAGLSLGAALMASLAVTSGVHAQDAQGVETTSRRQSQGTTYAHSVDLPGVTATSNTVNGYLKDTLDSLKFTQPVATTPKTIQVINDALIRDQQAHTLTEALQNTAGVGTFFMGENGDTTTGDSVYMRGFDASGSIFVDGIRDTGSISRDTFNTERVEVIKGPDGSEYGRTSLNGTINMVTKQARLVNGADMSISGGSHDQKRATMDINHVIDDTTAVRVNLLGQDSGVPGRDKARNKRWGIAPTIAFGLGTDTRLHLSYQHITQNNVPDGGASSIGLPGYTSPDPAHPEFDRSPRPRSSNFYGSSSDYDNVTSDMGTMRFVSEINDNLTFHDTARWGRTHQDYMISSFTAAYDESWNLDDLSHWRMSRLVNTKDQSNTILTNQAGLVQKLGDDSFRQTLSYGLELTREKVSVTGIDASDAPDINIYRPQFATDYHAIKNGQNATGTTDTMAAYLFDTAEIGDAWQLNAGLRLDHYKARYKSLGLCDARHPPEACGSERGHTLRTDINSSERKNLFTWQLGGLYKINEYGNIYAQYAVASQPPGTNGLVLSTKEKYPDRPNYDPQEATTAEIGSKWQLLDERLLLTGALFRTNVDHQVEQDIDGQYVQTGKKRVQGVELTLVGKLTPHWDVNAGYTHMSAKVRKGAAEAQDGSDNLNYTPDNAFTGWTTYRFPFGLTIGGGARYIGTMTRDKKGVIGTPDHISSYWVLDAMMKYRVNRHLDLQLNGYNLANKKYVASINKTGYRYTPGMPRTAMLSLDLKF